MNFIRTILLRENVAKNKVEGNTEKKCYELLFPFSFYYTIEKIFF